MISDPLKLWLSKCCHIDCFMYMIGLKQVLDSFPVLLPGVFCQIKVGIDEIDHSAYPQHGQ